MMAHVAPLTDADAADPGARPRARPPGRPARPGGRAAVARPCCSPATPASARPGCWPSCVDRAPRPAGAPLVGHCLDFGDSALPYLPFSELFGRLAADDPEAVAGALTEAHPALAHLQPGRRLLSGARPRRAPARTSTAPTSSRRCTARSTTLAERRSRCCVVVEDVHWADRSTRDLLSFLFARAVPRPGRGASRPTAPTTCTAGTRCARPPPSGSGSPACTGVQLDPLPDADVRRLVQALQPRARCPSATCTRSSRGPRATRSSPRSWSAPREGAPRRPACPTTSPTCCWSGSTGSTTTPARWSGPPPCAGRRVSHALLAAVRRPAPTTRSTAALRAAVEHNVLVRVGADGYAFRHALLAEAVYDDLLPGERVRLHAAYAEALRQQPRRRHRRRARPARPARPRPRHRGAGQHRGRRRGDVGRRPRRGGPALRDRARAARRRRATRARRRRPGRRWRSSAGDALIASGHPERAVKLVARPAAPPARQTRRPPTGRGC